MFIENVYPSQINPDVEQIILKLWKVRNRINSVYYLYLKVHTLWLYLLLIINPTWAICEFTHSSTLRSSFPGKTPL